GYVGPETNLGPTVLRALKLLEYRGYDSWGVAVGHDQHIDLEKHTGKIEDANVDLPRSEIGFGHTRWATHGGVTQPNAHPHLDCTGTLAVIHNGIIENFRELRFELIDLGHHFLSDTDSEVVAHMLEDLLREGDNELSHALSIVFGRLKGLNAVIAMDVRRHELVAAKTISPLVVGIGGAGIAIASDQLALQGHADRVLFPRDGQLVRLSAKGVSLYDRVTLAELTPDFVPLQVNAGCTELGRYPHFMAKEMAEQPDVIERLATESISSIAEFAREVERADDVYLIGCGTASYAALTGAYMFAKVANRPVTVAVGSEFSHYLPFLNERSLVIALSQSGETADIIEAMQAARDRGARLGAIVNSPSSTLDRMVSSRVLLNAGPEQCVLSTKAYTAKVATLLMAAHALNGTLKEGQDLVLHAANGLRVMLEDPWLRNVQAVAREIYRVESLYVVGRGHSYPTALESALKIKEVSYIHAEGFAGGELKHGVIALIAPGTPCIVFAPLDETHTDMLSGAMELKSRGARIIGVSPGHDPVFDIHIPVPDVGVASPIVNALPAQMLGYHTALFRGNDPDKPRNLAKSVTVK
ncbi:MAG: glutamine--fructose-6-phosphate transaminase (isomerizing), partial [Chloroflexota bacterium]|nr:glutamine--fructose-6-phosphate transaminase (isomerizing) [Chloroflexota bacterium]